MPKEVHKIAICCSHRIAVIVATSELRKAILKVIVRGAYVVGFMLDNNNLGGFGEFTRDILEQRKLMRQLTSG